MAIVLLEGYDHFAASSDPLLKGWDTNFNSMGTGRYGTGQYALRGASGGGTNFKNLPGTYTELWTGFAMRSSNPSIASTQLFLWRNGTTNTLRFANTASGFVQLINSAGTVILGPSTIAISATTWHYFEIYLLINGASGSVEMRIDGQPHLGPATVNIGSSGITNIGSGFVNSQNTQIDDLFVLDNVTPGPTGFQGECRIETLYTTAEGTTTQWIPSTGTDNALTIDDPTAMDGNDYNRSSTVGDKDTFVTGNLVTGSGSVLGLQTVILATKDGAQGTRQIASVIRHSGTDYDGANKTLGGSYAAFETIYNQDPTATDWTIASVNAAEFGVKLVT